jgi:hypothetical protein
MAVPALFRAGFPGSKVGAKGAVLVAEIAPGERQFPATGPLGIDMDEVRDGEITGITVLLVSASSQLLRLGGTKTLS